MTVIATVNEGYNMTKKGWFTQSVFSIIFSFFFGLVILPFAFLVAISTTLRGDITINNPGPIITSFSQFIDDIVKYPLFWLSIYLLLLVTFIFACILIGMIQFIGMKKFQTENLSLEDYVKHPFKNGRFLPFMLLAFLESILAIIIAGLMTIVRDWLGLNNQTATITSLTDVLNNFMTWQNLVYLILSLIVYLIIIPPMLISCFAIVQDKAKYNAFIVGWTNYFKSFVYFEEVTILSLIPIGVVIVLLGLIGLGIASVTGFETTSVSTTTISATDLSIILGLSFVIVLLSFIMLLFLLPLFLNTFGKSYEEQKS